MMQALGYLNRSWLRTALLYLFVVSLLGLLMRFLLAYGLPGINFKYILHAHSHTALLGWTYAALYIILLQLFLPAEVAAAKKYHRLFWLTQLAVLGMLLSFPFQGYAAVSITFSTLHILFSYAFIYFFLRDLKKTEVCEQGKVSVRFIKAALFFMALSTLGPFSLGPIMTTGHSGSQLYYLAIYYYLHFQYNGWFTFAVFGILFRWWEVRNITFTQAHAHFYFKLLFWACFPAYALSALWTNPPVWVFLLAGLAALTQFIALIYFFVHLAPVWRRLKVQLNRTASLLFILSFTAFALKIGLQLTSALPLMAHLAYAIREFIVGYLHMALLGFVGFFLFAYFIMTGAWRTDNLPAKLGLTFFLTGFILTELLLFLQGYLYWLYSFPLPAYRISLFCLTLLMPLGLGLFFIAQELKAAKSQLQS